MANGTDPPGDGACVTFIVSGTSVCLPEHLTPAAPAAAVEHGSLSLTWKQLRNGWSGSGYVTGCHTGVLAKLMIVDWFEMWLCASSPHSSQEHKLCSLNMQSAQSFMHYLHS